MKDSIINVFAVVGVFAIIIAIGMFLSFIVEDILDRIRITKRRMKREYEIAHRFEKKPLAKCHCIDCKYCRGFVSEHDWGPRAISCDLWGRNIVAYDDSFCYRAEPKM
ncbi:hypothetical protein [uncultured Eubacterium sp.]|uniref:hypothetical protein n=1 Tax=uncultured Eubacterium sp. TaxID=165185 RepID=UPI002599FE0C|nr:hypothetical protein [uncultured Eubacterium sp.]